MIDGINLTSYIDQTIFVSMIMLGVFVITGLLLFIIWIKKHDIKVRIRYRTSSHDKVKDVKGRYYNKNGEQKLIVMEKLFKPFNMTMPPSNAISILENGKDSIEIMVTPDGDKKYIIKNIESNSFKAFNSNDRIFMVNEQEKRQKRMKKSIGEIMLALAPLFAIVIIIAMVLGFWSSVMEPFNERMKQAESFELKMMSHLVESQQLMNEILQKEQIIREHKVQQIPD